MAIVFAIANAAKIPGYAALGMFEGVDWKLVALLSGSGIVGTFIGRWTVKRLTDRTYSRVIEVLLLVLSIMLVIKAGRLLWIG